MELTFYYCSSCGNLLIPAIDAFVVPECCGVRMDELKPGSVDAAVEKHVPVIVRDADSHHICVSIGSVPHPMAEDHYIQFVVIVRGDRFGVISLKPGDDPGTICMFDDNVGDISAYAYCNLHGLWEAALLMQ